MWAAFEVKSADDDGKDPAPAAKQSKVEFGCSLLVTS